jgi:hypothetical protein
MPKHNLIIRDNFVAPDPPPPRVEILGNPLGATDLPPAPISQPYPHSSYHDRALGFTLATAPLAGVAALVAALVGILGFQVPIMSLAALLLALGGFALVWLCAYALHVWVSPDGALLAHTLLMWRLLFLEARERRKRYGLRK